MENFMGGRSPQIHKKFLQKKTRLFYGKWGGGVKKMWSFSTSSQFLIYDSFPKLRMFKPLDLEALNVYFSKTVQVTKCSILFSLNRTFPSLSAWFPHWSLVAPPPQKVRGFFLFHDLVVVVVVVVAAFSSLPLRRLDGGSVETKLGGEVLQAFNPCTDSLARTSAH